MTEPDLRGMNSVRVRRDAVLAKLRTNRDGHRAVFEEALEGFHKAVVEHLTKALKDAKAGKSFQWQAHLPQPEDHTKDYDRVIALLEMSLDNELELPATDFAQYVLDDWGWKGNFLATSSNYTNVR